MTEAIADLDSCVRAVNGFCADLDCSPETSLALDDLRRRIDEHRESHDDPDRVFAALSVACGYTTRTGQLASHGDLAFGEWVPGWIDVEPDSVPVCPPPLGCVDGVIRGRWAVLALEAALHPLVRERLADLLSALGQDSSCEFGRVAVRGCFEALSDPAIDEGERITALGRLAHLCDGLQDSRLMRIVEHHQPPFGARRGAHSADGEPLVAA